VKRYDIQDNIIAALFANTKKGFLESQVFLYVFNYS